jgi:predicted N-acetyltransferase YhbS
VSTTEVAGLTLVERAESHDRTRMALVDVDQAGAQVDACTLTIDRLELHDGAGGLVRVDGIGNVATLESHRRRGLARELVYVAIERMRAAGASASLLYGIDDFYDPFGWRSCGDERWVHVPLARWTAPSLLPAFTTRRMRPGDLDALRARYEHIATGVPGAAARTSGRAWTMLEPAEVTLVERAGELVGWAWRGRGRIAERDAIEQRLPDHCAVFAELQAIDDEAMLAVLDAAVAVARDDVDRPSVAELVVGAGEQHPLRRLARASSLECRLVDEVRPHGGAMLLPFDPAGDALFASGDLFQFTPDRF